MAINYSIAAMKNPNPMAEEEVKYYAKAQANGVVTIDQLAEEIAYSTTLTDGDVLNTIRAQTLVFSSLHFHIFLILTLLHRKIAF